MNTKTATTLHVLLSAVFFAATAFLFVVCLDAGLDREAHGAEAQAQEEELEIVKKQLEGTVGLVRPNYVTIIFAQDEKKGIESEMGFKVSGDVRLIRKRQLKEFEAGDIVKVVFDEGLREYEETQSDGSVQKKKAIVERNLKSMEFIKKPAKFASGE